MNLPFKPLQVKAKLLQLVFLALLLSLASPAQVAAPVPPPNPAPTQPATPTPTPVPSPSPTPSAAPPAEEHHLTPAEAKELFRSVDDILQFASRQTGLPVLHSVKKKLATRQEVAKYIENRLKEQGNGERFDRSARSLKKLGLLPRDFNLREYMLGLYKEQVEGWYDAHNKTVYLLDWVEPDLQKPVMAHELVHALQDQSFDLETWLNVDADSKDETVQLALDEQRTARQSVIEGQAMIVLYDYQLTSVGQTVESAPDLVDSMKSSALDEDPDSMYGKAPIYLREAMLFPYSYGMEFSRAILVKRGKQAAYRGVFEHPPVDTRQIMQPETYFASEPQPQLKIVQLDKILGSDWRQEDVSGIGEIDLRVILRQWAGNSAAAQLAPAWRGGYYMALSRKKQPKDAPYPLALVLNFSSPEAANRFAAIYESELPQRYKQLQAAPTPAACNTGSLRAFQPRVPRSLTSQWATEEGSLCLYVDGPSVTAFESFVPADAARLHAALIPIVTTPLIAPEITPESQSALPQ